MILGILGPLTCGCSSLAGSLILYPTRHLVPTSAVRDTMTGRTAPVTGCELELYYEEFGPAGSGEPEVYVLAFTGNAGRAESTTHCVAQLLPSWFEDGVRTGVLALQYPGYGQSQGATSFSALAAAGLDAFDHLRARAGERPIVLYGFSLGSTVALHVARARQPDLQGLILEKPPNLRSMILWGYGWWNLWLLAGPVALGIPESARSDRNASEVEDVPAIFVLGTRDRIVALRNARQVVEAYGGPYRVVLASIDHNEAATEESAPGLAEAMRWLRRQ